MASSARLKLLLGLAAIFVAIAAIWLLRPLPPPGPRPQRPDEPPPPEQLAAAELVTLKNLGLGLLENHEFDRAIETFQKIQTALPKELFAARNLAIAQVKQTTEAIDDRADPEAFAKGLAASRSAIDGLEVLEPNTGLSHFLRAVLATKVAGEAAEIVKHLERATQRDPNNAAWWFQWFELGRSLRDAAEKEAAFTAGQTAADLAADNLYVQKEFLAEWLMRQTDAAKRAPDEAARQSEAILERLEQLREPLRVLGVSIQVQARVDVVAILDTVAAAVRAADWPKARNEFFKIKNLLSQETASDADLIHPHPLTYHDPLNYVALDFSPAFYETADLPDDALPKIEVTWKETEGVLPKLSQAALQLDTLDFDLDGVDDLVELEDKQLVIHRRFAKRDGWESISFPLTGSSRREFVSADLDDDVVDLTANKPGELGPVAADRCHDADPDFVLFGKDGVQLLENVLDAESKSRRLKVVPADVAGFGELKHVDQVKLVDFDHDGDLDLVTVASGKLGLWSNRGGFRFLDVTGDSLLPGNEFQVQSVAAVDWDRDNDVDLLLSGATACGWLENLRHGRMRFHVSTPEWVDAGQLDVAELDGDGHWDLVVSGEQQVKVLFSAASLAGAATIARRQVVFESPFKRLELNDFDNDGGTDLLVTRGATAALLRNLGRGTFEPEPDFPQAIPAGSTHYSMLDADADGDLDVLCTGLEQTVLLNEGGNKNNSLTVKFRGQQVKANEQGASRRVNHYGVGNTVEVKVGNRYQAQLAEGQATRFGIGPAAQADIVRVIATNGVPQNRIEPKANELICERQVLLTSCPYLYAWNGSRYEFVTDLVWASPLGLKASQTELVPWRDWEYLKIDGAKLQPLDGEYRLQITEELWEAAYFDQVKLFAVDHPADTQIFTNEKVGSPALAAHKIHTVRKPLALKAARDQAGRDWLPQLAERDEQYTRTYQRKIAQGLCEEHSLELDLGELASPREIKLFLTGWVRPTDTNINVALDQNPELPSPSGLALWTPDGQGTWREVSPHVGFPNGKTKTIVLDVSQAFSRDDYRLRLVSNREFYWDQAFFTVDEEPVAVREWDLSLLRADLHDRGVSRGILPTGDGPETYDYDQLAAIPPWPRMDGMFTRFGDVWPLLVERDDRQVVLGVGDEMTLAFRVPSEPLPDGWMRDFVIHNVGWVKDCLLNTWEGQRVEPLPFAKLNGHDYWTGAPDPGGEYGDFLRTYQTRRQVDRFRGYVRKFTPDRKQAIPLWERSRRTGD